MSTTLDQIEPAAATGSTLAFSIARMFPVARLRSCGAATFGWDDSVAAVAIVSRMPSGSKIRVRTISAQGFPLTAASTSPAVWYITF